MNQLLHTLRNRIATARERHPVPYAAHLIGWILLLPGYLDYFGRIGVAPTGPRDLAVLMTLQVLFFYVAVGWLLPAAFRHRKKRYYRIPLYLAAELAVAVLLLIGLSIASGQLHLRWQAGAPVVFEIANLMAVLSPILYLTCLLALGYQTLVWGIDQSRRKARLGNRVARLRQSLQLAQQDWLRKQLDPHLLASLLSLLRNLAYTNDQALANAMNAVIGMMQFYASQRDDVPFIPLSQELEQVERLLYINRLAGSPQKRIHVLVSGPVEEQAVIPMLLVTLAENQLKYAAFTDAHVPATLAVTASPVSLRIRTQNDIDPEAATRHKGTGTGLGNIRRRLELLYGDRFNMTYGGSGSGRFVVDVVIANPPGATQMK